MFILTKDFFILEKGFKKIEEDSEWCTVKHNIEHGAIPLLPNPNQYFADIVIIDCISEPKAYLHITIDKFSHSIGFEHIYVLNKFRRSKRAREIMDHSIEYVRKNLHFKSVDVSFTTEGGEACYMYFKNELLPNE